MLRNTPIKTALILRTKITLIIFGFFLFLVLLETGLRLGGFLLLSVQEYRNMQSIKRKGAYLILCLGESTTQEQYPKFLMQVLNQRNIGLHFSVVDKGRVGNNTSGILSEVEFYLNEYHPDMVVTMMGINDFGEHLYFEAATTSKGLLFIRSLRTYKFARLLWLHILTKTKEDRCSKKVQTYLPENGLKEDNTKSILAEYALKKVLEFNPKGDNAYVELGRLYRNQGKLTQAEDAFRKAIELNPSNGEPYFELGQQYRDHGKLPQAEDALKKALELNPKNDYAYFSLGWFYQYQGKFPQAEDLFKKALELSPKNDRYYAGMSTLYEETGKSELAEEYAKKADRLRLKYYSSLTVNNYRRLKKILDQRGIELVCVQYPMRNVDSLKKIFEQDQGVTFVDNEKIFKKAVKQSSYKDYFHDMFAGDFGHCTDKGNRLLAQNIANTILKEVFSNKHSL